MSTNRGIFESFPNQPDALQDSPFTVIAEYGDTRLAESSKPAKLPESRKQDVPFQMAEPSEGFGFEAVPHAFGASPLEVAPAPAAPAPFSAPAQPAVSPFAAAADPQRGPSSTAQAAIAAFSTWQESQPAPAAPFSQVFEASSPPPFSQVAQVPSAFSATPQQAAPVDGSHSDSFAIRQLELRAIFGVDRELTPDEILQRSRALPGIRNVARVAAQDMATIEALKSLLPNLGFGSGALKLHAGSVPLEFIREGAVLLAVQTDGGFAPGVRETLMIVARELGRTS